MRVLSLVFVLAAPVLAQEHEKVITPYPGSKLATKDGSDFAQYEVVLGPAKGAKYTRLEVKEGRVTRLKYTNPDGRSRFEIFSNYRDALKKAGFELVFSCIEKECGDAFGVANAEKGIGWMPEGGSHYLAARLPAKTGLTWVSLHVVGTATLIHFVTEKPMEDDLVKVDAAALAKGLETDGHVAVYGILFDTGKDVLKPESAPVIAEVAKLLKNRPTLKLHVVGHTDSQGVFEANQDLSKRRGIAVVRELVKKHGIEEARLRGDGVGPLCPVATNDTDAGRAKNRRVELVSR